MGKFTHGNSKASKLTNEQVFEIREKYFREEEDYTQGRLSREYHVTVGTIGRIVNGLSRQNVPMPRPGPTQEEIAASQAKLQAYLARDAQEREDKLVGDIQKEYDAKVKPSKDLDGLLTPELRERAKGYGAR
jgi:hypothetical protein